MHDNECDFYHNNSEKFIGCPELAPYGTCVGNIEDCPYKLERLIEYVKSESKW